METEKVEFKLVVLSDRFPNNEFYFRYPEAHHRFDNVAFPRGIKLGRGFILKEFRLLLRSAIRRTVLALPSSLTKFISAWYLHQQHASTEDYFQAMNPVDLANAVQQIAEFRPHHLFLDSIKLTEITKSITNAKCQTYLVMSDLIYARLMSLGQATNTKDQDSLFNELQEVKAKELECFTAFTHILAIQKHEATYVKENFPDKSVLYVPMPALAINTARDFTPSSKHCLFVGSQGNSNVQGISWFLNEVWPTVLEQVPEAVLDICGTCCAYLDSRLPSVKLHGRVADLQAFYEHADVCIVPLLGGSGMKIKLVDALAQGSACVTTSVGMQGLESGSGSAFIHADSAKVFADSVILLMTNQPKRDKLRFAAAEFVENQLAPNVVFSELRDLVHQKLKS